MSDPLLLKPGMILQAGTLPSLPLHPEHVPNHLYLQVDRIMHQMIDFCTLDTLVTPVPDHPYWVELSPAERKEQRTPATVQPASTQPSRTLPAAPFAFAGPAPSAPKAAPAASDKAGRRWDSTRTYKDDFAHSYSNWVPYEGAHQVAMWPKIVTAAWHGLDRTGYDYDSTKIPAEVVNSIGMAAFAEFCLTSLDYLPQQVNVMFQQAHGQPYSAGPPSSFGTHNNTLAYYMLRNDTDLAHLRLRFGPIISR